MYALSPGPGMAVSRHLVHKSAHAEVLLTGWLAVDDTFIVTAQWPRGHGFYHPRRGFHDPLLFAETVRQALSLLSHEAFDVPLDHQLVWKDLSFHVLPDALRVGPQPLEVRLVVTCVEAVRRRGMLAAACMRMTAWADGSALGHAHTRYSAHSPGVYRRLRAGRHDTAAARANALPPAEGVPPEKVARHLPGDVVLSPTRHLRTWQLRVDLDHPILFDHPVDHVPGMLLLEAARQAAITSHPAGCTIVTSMTTRFHRYLELDRPVWLTLTSDSSDLLNVRVEQDHVTCFEAAVGTTRQQRASLPRQPV
ncbi:ScbA/BarX family gamma-butyrolactone biosynthesis protein [Streptomyces sp. ACA25]|uniref:ScbA/BarX family gamma-butyrolactone biosynthesis protein n=1 Tax=Streptomyces sp. ACA25 TaxID=3022596 RepID=UPI002307A45B|nr:ScbA/BarX family gamma-butyrolactone biosynthesis protein [Streptomyces sp. ACA25]MDB1090273.1 ScbA/BarX family gamma-butyrolactone biosynthesis protein [Streptomyces sp. ACA25]